ncbi:MAG: hypothetical protein P4L99_07625 [Chthoniobacter sp.]|nr:hypothetical protein [Chthoniobacter sp.]
MKTIASTLFIFAALFGAANAQAPLNPNIPDPPQRVIRTGTPRDGFFVRDTHVFIVRNGVTTRVDREILFPNGLRVQPNGTVTMRDGSEVTLLPNQWLDFEGALDDYVAEAPTGPTKAADRDSGISARDGVTISGTDVFITRNGATSKVTTNLQLSNGVIVHPDGTVLLGNGKKITLRANQLLDLHGVLHEAPVIANPAGGVEPSSNPAR